MTAFTGTTLAAASIDAAALKPAEAVVSRAVDLDVETVAERTERLHGIGVDTIVDYPACGLDPFIS